MSTTIYLTQEDKGRYADINPYTYTKDTLPENLFLYAMYPYFTYYKNKTGSVIFVDDATPVQKQVNTLREKEVCICLATNTLSSFFLNTFKSNGGKYFYISKDIATRDIERTWVTLEKKINFSSVDRVHFIFPHFTKLVHAYRIRAIYNKEVIDSTYTITS